MKNFAFQIVGYIPTQIEDFPQDSDDTLNIKLLSVDSVLETYGKKTRVWALTSPIEAAQPQLSAVHTVKIGLPKCLLAGFPLSAFLVLGRLQDKGKASFSWLRMLFLRLSYAGTVCIFCCLLLA